MGETDVLNASGSKPVSSDTHFDSDLLQTYDGNDPAVIAQVVDLTKKGLTEWIQRLNKLIEVRDMKGIKSVGNKIYGTAAIAGLLYLQK